MPLSGSDADLIARGGRTIGCLTLRLRLVGAVAK